MPNSERRIQHNNPAASDKSRSFGARRYFAAFANVIPKAAEELPHSKERRTPNI